MGLALFTLPHPAEVRLTADYDVQVKPAMLDDLTEQQLVLLQSILASPAALSRIARLSVEADLSGISGSHLDDLFQGPSNEELWACAVGSLAKAEGDYWEAFRIEDSDAAYQEIITVFLTFQVTLRRAAVEELSSTSESYRKTVGPTLDASKF